MEKIYCIYIPGNFYPLQFRAESKKEAREDYLRWANKDRMPRGHSIVKNTIK